MKKIALINDLSGFGRCSLTAAIPVVSIMGLQACPLPTAILTAQTGFTSYYCDDYTDKMDFFTKEWHALQTTFDGIHSGFLASPKQIQKVLDFLDIFQTPDTVYLADPVMGDHGQTMKAYTNTLLSGMKELVNRSTICTPNLTELCLLTGQDFHALTKDSDSADYLSRITEIAQLLLSQNTAATSHKPTVLITGILRNHQEKAMVGNLAVNAQEHFYIEAPYTGKSFSGTGDLFAAVICSSLTLGYSLEHTMQKAIDFLQPAIEDASLQNLPSTHGVLFEAYLPKLLS